MTKEPNQKQNSPKKPSKPQGGKPIPRNRGPFSRIIMGIIIVLVLTTLRQLQQVHEIKYSPDFLSYIQKGYVKSVVFHDYKIVGELNEKGIDALELDTPNFKLNYGSPMKDEDLLEKLDKAGVEIDKADPDIWSGIIWNLLPLLFLIGIIYFVFIRNMKA